MEPVKLEPGKKYSFVLDGSEIADIQTALSEAPFKIANPILLHISQTIKEVKE